MSNFLAGLPIHKDSSGCRAQQIGNEIVPSQTKTQMSKHFQKKRPRNLIERLRNVKLEEKIRYVILSTYYFKDWALSPCMMKSVTNLAA